MKKTIDPKKTQGEVGYADLTAKDQSLVERAVRNKFSRRDVLKLMAVTGVSMATAQNLLSTGQEAMAQTPKKAGQSVLRRTCTVPMTSLTPRCSHPLSTTLAVAQPITAWFSMRTT